jgi:seryl-tRNA(Sec) selenium transferase
MTNPFAALGVRPFINCVGSRTVFGGSRMPQPVLEAFNDAARRFASVPELADAAGKRIAELVGAEAALIASGGSGALLLAAAGAVTRGDPEKIIDLPRVDPARRLVVTPRGSRFAYDQSLRAVGVEIVSLPDRESMARALEGPVAMIVLLGTADATSPIKVEDAAALARGRDIPVLVDAASEHLHRRDPYLARGANLVAYSGGKFLRGPQSTGLLIGDARWIAAAALNASPHHSIARHLKISKEEIIGLVAAVEHWAEHRDLAGEVAAWCGELDAIAKASASFAGTRGEMREPTGVSERTPSLKLAWDRARTGLDGLALCHRLAEGEPRIMLDDRSATADSITILPFNLQPGEGRIVGEAIAAALAAVAPAQPRAKSAPAADLSGIWDLEIALPARPARHVLEIRQDGGALAGMHRMRVLASPFSGEITGRAVELSSLHPCEGTNLAYRFTGEVDGVSMRGSVELGTSGQSAPGPVNRREYGTAPWTARRRG